MRTPVILAAVGLGFLFAGLFRLSNRQRALQSRTWVLVGAIFVMVSTWLMLHK